MRAIIVAIAAALLMGASQDTANLYQPGMAWVHDSSEWFYVIRMRPDHKCYIAMYYRPGKVVDLGECHVSVSGSTLVLDMTNGGVFENGLTLSDLKELRLSRSSDADELVGGNPPRIYRRMTNAEAEKLKGWK